MQRYFITDPVYYDSVDSFSAFVSSAYEFKKYDYICIRDNTASMENLSLYIDVAKSFCEKNNIKLLLNGYINLAIEKQLYGIHLKSHQLEKIPFCKQHNLFIIYSAHNRDDILKAKELGADAVTISPIFKTKYHFDQLGIEGLISIVKGISGVKIFALGGIIEESQVAKLHNIGLFGFASIRFFPNPQFSPKNPLTFKNFPTIIPLP